MIISESEESMADPDERNDIEMLKQRPNSTGTETGYSSKQILLMATFDVITTLAVN